MVAPSVYPDWAGTIVQGACRQVRSVHELEASTYVADLPAATYMQPQTR